jgi:hypothetical protein
MDEIFESVISTISAAFDQVTLKVPPPHKVRYADGYVYRFRQQGFEEAIVLKFARLITLLQSGKLLLANGFLQELGAIQRMLSEADADILFLCGPLIFGASEPSHNRYLTDFFLEEFDKPGDAVGSTQKRTPVGRSKIIAYNARTYEPDTPVDKTVELYRTLEKSYSGFVHAAAVHSLDLYYGSPPKFHIRGMKGTQAQRESENDFKNYIYRSVLTAAWIAQALDCGRLREDLSTFSEVVGDALHLNISLEAD